MDRGKFVEHKLPGIDNWNKLSSIKCYALASLNEYLLREGKISHMDYSYIVSEINKIKNYTSKPDLLKVYEEKIAHFVTLENIHDLSTTVESIKATLNNKLTVHVVFNHIGILDLESDKSIQIQNCFTQAVRKFIPEDGLKVLMPGQIFSTHSGENEVVLEFCIKSSKSCSLDVYEDHNSTESKNLWKTIKQTLQTKFSEMRIIKTYWKLGCIIIRTALVKQGGSIWSTMEISTLKSNLKWINNLITKEMDHLVLSITLLKQKSHKKIGSVISFEIFAEKLILDRIRKQQFLFGLKIAQQMSNNDGRYNCETLYSISVYLF